MNTRRRFLQRGMKVLAGIGLLLCSFPAGASALWAEAKKIILPKGTARESLIRRNPAELDTRNLEITPVEDFGTMGPTDLAVDLSAWRLEVKGEGLKPLRLTYEQILRMPSIERKVLLICPGVFANYGTWRGISILTLLRMAEIGDGITHVEVRGPNSSYEKVVRYPLEDVLSKKVFLAYGVNGQTLPREHGFPLRVVAEDYFGFDWVKYVSSVTALVDHSDRRR